jgi:hypothetical protein
MFVPDFLRIFRKYVFLVALRVRFCSVFVFVLWRNWQGCRKVMFIGVECRSRRGFYLLFENVFSSLFLLQFALLRRSSRTNERTGKWVSAWGQVVIHGDLPLLPPCFLIFAPSFSQIALKASASCLMILLAFLKSDCCLQVCKQEVRTETTEDAAVGDCSGYGLLAQHLERWDQGSPCLLSEPSFSGYLFLFWGFLWSLHEGDEEGSRIVVLLTL